MEEKNVSSLVDVKMFPFGENVIENCATERFNCDANNPQRAKGQLKTMKSKGGH